MVVVIGQDGLVANTAKYAKTCPIVAVNPDKARYDGVLLPFDATDFMGGVERVVSGGFASRTMRFAEARLNDVRRLRAFNDLFVGAASHVSAHYKYPTTKSWKNIPPVGLSFPPPQVRPAG